MVWHHGCYVSNDQVCRRHGVIVEGLKVSIPVPEDAEAWSVHYGAKPEVFVGRRKKYHAFLSAASNEPPLVQNGR